MSTNKLITGAVVLTIDLNFEKAVSNFNFQICGQLVKHELVVYSFTVLRSSASGCKELSCLQYHKWTPFTHHFCTCSAYISIILPKSTLKLHNQSKTLHCRTIWFSERIFRQQLRDDTIRNGGVRFTYSKQQHIICTHCLFFFTIH